MKLFVIALAAVAVLASSATATAQQVEFNVTVQAEHVKGSANDHFLTFSGPVQIPDVTLPAGTYVFSLVAPSIIQVSSVDRRQRYAMFYTAPIQRSEAQAEYDVTIVPTFASAPGRITKMFLPSRTNGVEFLYLSDETRGER